MLKIVNIMKKQIKLSLSIYEAKILHNGASQERKLELEELFPELKPPLITDRVKTYEDALRELGKKDFSRENLYNREIARRKLEIIIEALNEGWKPDLSNHQEDKWYCYFNGLGTLGCSYPSASPAFAYASVGVPFCLKSEKLTEYIGEQFKDLFEEMLLG